MIGNKKIECITPRLVKDLISNRLQEVEVSTSNRELAVLKRIFSYAVLDLAVISSNPISSVPQKSGASRRTRWISKEEEDRLIEASPEWLGRIIKFAINTGMRRSEILNLKWDHVFIDKKYAYVDKSKNGKRRNIPLSDVAIEVLRSAHNDENEFVFEGVCNSTLELAFKTATILSCIGDLHFHDLRHTFCTRLVMGGADLYRVQLLAGHSSPAITQRYAHHSVDSLRDAIEILNNGG